jgi:hypothetical protein
MLELIIILVVLWAIFGGGGNYGAPSILWTILTIMFIFWLFSALFGGFAPYRPWI